MKELNEGTLMSKAGFEARTVEPEEASAFGKVLLPTALITFVKSREVSVKFLKPRASAINEK